MTYFVSCPSCGFEEFKTVEERDANAAACIEHHLHDSWDEDVTGVVSGVIQERAVKCNVKFRPENLDEDLCDSSGWVWPIGCDYTCDYTMWTEEKAK